MSGPETASRGRTVARLVGGELDGQERRLDGAPLLLSLPVFPPVPRSSSGYRDWHSVEEAGRVTSRRGRRLPDHAGAPRWEYEATGTIRSARRASA